MVHCLKPVLAQGRDKKTEKRQRREGGGYSIFSRIYSKTQSHNNGKSLFQSILVWENVQFSGYTTFLGHPVLVCK